MHYIDMNSTNEELLKERQLIEAARTNPDKFGELFDKYYQQVFSYTLKRVADVGIAQDVTSETFYKAYSKLWMFKWRGIPFVAWLYRIASNEIKSYYRATKRELVSIDQLREESGYEPADMVDIENELIEAEDKLLRYSKFLEVQEKISRLDEKYQEVIQLRFFENLKIKEIGEVLGKSPGTVKSLVSRGLKKLRNTVSSDTSGIEVNDLRSLEHKQPLAFAPVNPSSGKRVIL